MARMGRQHVHDRLIDVRQQKTGAALSIPIHPELRAIIDSMPVDNLNFMMTATGKPFTANGFCHWFFDRCREAGLPAGPVGSWPEKGNVPAARRGWLLGSPDHGDQRASDLE